MTSRRTLLVTFHRTLASHDPSLFFINDTPTTEIYTLSLHDALPISLLHASRVRLRGAVAGLAEANVVEHLVRPLEGVGRDRKSTRLNSSHRCISYAVFCLKKKKKTHKDNISHNYMTNTRTNKNEDET